MAADRRLTRSVRKRPLAAKIVFGLVILGFAGLAARVAVTLARPVDLLDQKIAGAQRYLYYQFTPTSGPTFVLAGTEAEIHLVTHAVIPPTTENYKYDPARELLYGARVELELGGGETWTREVYARARQSKDRLTGDLYLDENAFALDGKLQVSDDRVLIVVLPKVSAGARLRVRLVGDAREGYLRAYTPIPRPDTERHVRDLPGAVRKRIAEATSYVPWDRLTQPEDLASMRFAPHRLWAEGKEGQDYETRTLYTTGFRLPYALVTQRGTPVTPDHAIAVNVVGPAGLVVLASKPLDGSDGAVTVSITGDNEPQSPEPITVALGESQSVKVPAGVHTLALSTNARAFVELLAPQAAAITLGKIADAPLVPDEQLLTAYVAGPKVPAIEIALDGPDDLAGKVVRADVRLLASTPCLAATGALRRWPNGTISPSAAKALPPNARPCTGAAPPPDLLTGTLLVDALDGTGKVIATSTGKIESVPSKFEVAKLFGNFSASVTEPISIRFIAPPGGKLVRLRTDRAALLQVATPVMLSPPQDQLDVPYDSGAPLATTMWRYARYKERGWLPVRARDDTTLAPDRVAQLAVQARLEPKIIPPAPEIASTSLPPAGRLEQQTVVEPVPGDDTALFLARWGDGHYTRLQPGKTASLDLGRLPSRPSITYVAGDDNVGKQANITIDSMIIEEKLSASRGSLKLPAGLAGKHDVTVDAPAGVRLLIDRPPAPGTRGELVAVRSIYRVTRGVRIAVRKKTADPQNVDIVLYARTAAADPNAQIRVVIDGGHPARRAGIAVTRWTLAERTLPLAPADRPATLGFANTGGDALYPRLVAIALGDDLPAGTHTVEVSVTSGPPMWARLFTFDGVPPAPRALQWRVAADVGESN